MAHNEGVQTELSYVRQKLLAIGSSRWIEIGKDTDVAIRTIRRIAHQESKHAPRSDNVGKIALWFRTKEKRRT